MAGDAEALQPQYALRIWLPSFAHVESGNMLIMVLALLQKTGDLSIVQTYVCPVPLFIHQL